MVYKKYIKISSSEDNNRLNKLKYKFFLKNKAPILFFSLILLVLLILVIIIFNENNAEFSGKAIDFNEGFVNNEKYIGERCASWGRCTIDYNIENIFNNKYPGLFGVERRECLDKGKIIIQRRVCDPTVSVKTEKIEEGLGIIGEAPPVEAILPSLKITKEGVEGFEPVPELEKEVLVSVIRLYEEKGVKRLDVDIIV